MSHTSYDYSAREGIRPVSWEDFHGLVRALAAAVAPWRPRFILPILRGGIYPGALLAHMLQAELYPVRLSRRENDMVVHERPRWLVDPPAAVVGQPALLVDEMCDTGETLTLARERTLEFGAAEVRTAVLYAHTWGATVPDYIGLITDEMVLNPWDREIYRDGAFQPHPEYAAALAGQGVTMDDRLLITATPFKVDKAT